MNSTPLTAMQRAYLLGKSKMFPLSQSSMHDFQEFHGRMDVETLTQRLTQLIALYPALRTTIDEMQLMQVIEPEINLNQQLKVYDLSHLNSMEATIQLEILRDEYRHFSHDLSTPPWQIAWIQLPETFEEQTVVLTSFDGLIIDGYSISVILNSLFDVNQDLNLLDKDSVHDKNR